MIPRQDEGGKHRKKVKLSNKGFHQEFGSWLLLIIRLPLRITVFDPGQNPEPKEAADSSYGSFEKDAPQTGSTTGGSVGPWRRDTVVWLSTLNIQ